MQSSVRHTDGLCFVVGPSIGLGQSHVSLATLVVVIVVIIIDVVVEVEVEMIPATAASVPKGFFVPQQIFNISSRHNSGLTRPPLVLYKVISPLLVLKAVFLGDSAFVSWSVHVCEMIVDR